MKLLLTLTSLATLTSAYVNAEALQQLSVANLNGGEAIGAFCEPKVSATWLAAGSTQPEKGVGTAVHLWHLVDHQWQVAGRLPSPEKRETDGFGTPLELSDRVLAVAAPGALVDEREAGSVYLYRRDGESWVLSDTLRPPNAVADGRFGRSLALNGARLAVGSTPEAADGKSKGPGRVDLFRHDGSQWVLEQTIETPPGTYHAYRYAGEAFGNAVSLSGDWLAVSAMGEEAVFLYHHVEGRWELAQRLDARRHEGDAAEGPAFGRHLDLDGDQLIVGSLGAGGTVPDSGAVTIYRLGKQWLEEARLESPEAATGAMFGHWASYDRGVLVVSAFRATAAGRKGAGVAWRFVQTAKGWEAAGQLLPEGSASLLTGYTLDVQGGHVVLSGGDQTNPMGGNFVWVGKADAPDQS